MIEWKNLRPLCGKDPTAHDLNFKFLGDRTYGVVVENDAVGTALADTVTGCLSPYAGTVRINGLDLQRDALGAKRCIGYAPAVPSLYGDMTPREMLAFVAQAGDRDIGRDGREIERWLEFAGLTDVADRLISRLTAEERRFVCVAQAMLGEPSLVVLDDPLRDLEEETEKVMVRLLQEVCASVSSTIILVAVSERMPRAVCDEVLNVGDEGIVPEKLTEEPTEALSHRVIDPNGEAQTVALPESGNPSEEERV